MKTNAIAWGRWMMLLQGYKFRVKHRPGKGMAHVDCMNRAPAPIGQGDADFEMQFPLPEDIIMKLNAVSDAGTAREMAPRPRPLRADSNSRDELDPDDGADAPGGYEDREAIQMRAENNDSDDEDIAWNIPQGAPDDGARSRMNRPEWNHCI